MIHKHEVEEPFLAYRNMVLQWGQETFCSLFCSDTLTLPQIRTIHTIPAYFDLTADNDTQPHHSSSTDLNTKPSTLHHHHHHHHNTLLHHIENEN